MRDLVERAMAGDEDAFNELTRLSIGQLYAIARLILRDEAKAEDATQEALVSAWRHIRSLRDPDRFDAWLRRSLVRACHKEARRHQRWQLLDNRVRPLDRVEQDPTSDIANQDQLERGFRRLNADQRTVLVLHYSLDLPLSELALTLGQPEGTVKSRLNRAIHAMRAALAADSRSSTLQGELP